MIETTGISPNTSTIMARLGWRWGRYPLPVDGRMALRHAGKLMRRRRPLPPDVSSTERERAVARLRLADLYRELRAEQAQHLRRYGWSLTARYGSYTAQNNTARSAQRCAGRGCGPHTRCISASLRATHAVLSR